MTLTKLRKKLRNLLSPAQQIAISFASVILTGAFLLNLPISNKMVGATFIDHLFTSTTAVCVTGLSTVVLADQYTLFGQWVIIALMQIGGLGLMTLIAVFIIFLSGKLSLANRLALNEAVNFFNLNDFNHFIMNILKYTLIFESIGFLLYATRFVPEFGWSSGLFISLFTAVSAFVNAGLDILGPISLQGYAHDPIVNFTTMYLIVVGGLGFGVWFDLSQGSKSLIRKAHPLQYVVKHLKVHTKIVITTTLYLIFGGALLILLIEFNNPNTIQSFNFFDKIMASLFQSITTRTAGFATLNMASMKAATLLIMMLLMFIGGSPGGTAGGIKTTTFAILVLMIVSELRNRKEIIVFNRKIEREQFRKAFVIAFVLLMTVTTGIIILLIIEPFDLLSIAFESISAIATVGLSMGITASLSYWGKVTIIALMYLGRIGPLTLMLSIGRKQSSKKGHDISYPAADILIG